MQRWMTAGLAFALVVVCCTAATAASPELLEGTWRYTNEAGDTCYEVTFGADWEYQVETLGRMQGTYSYDEEAGEVIIILPGVDDEPDEVETYKVFFEDGYLVLAKGDSFYRNKLLWQPEEPECILTGRWIEMLDEEDLKFSWWGAVYMEFDDDGTFTILVMQDRTEGEYVINDEGRVELEFLGELAEGIYSAKADLVLIYAGEESYACYYLP